MSVNRYRTLLERQGRGAIVTAINGIPILLALGRTNVKRIMRALRLSSMMALRASTNAADARIERKIRFEYAKIKAKGKLRSQTVRYASVQQHKSCGYFCSHEFT